MSIMRGLWSDPKFRDAIQKGQASGAVPVASEDQPPTPALATSTMSAAPAGPSPKTKLTVRGIAISPTEATMAPGQQMQFTAKRVFADGAPPADFRVAWSSDTPDVVSIDKNSGLATCKVVPGGGAKVKLKATDEEFSVSAAITITADVRLMGFPMPNGQVLAYFSDEKAKVLPLIHEAARTSIEAESLSTSLDKMSTDMIKAASLIKPQASVVKEIADKATEMAVVQADIAKVANQVSEILKEMLDKSKEDLDEAKENLKLDESELNKAQKQQEADSLRKKGQQLDSLVGYAINQIANGLSLAAGIEAGNPLIIGAAGVKVIGELFKLFGASDLVAEAATLEAEAKAIGLDNAAKRYQLAGTRLKRVADRVAKAHTRAKKAEETYAQFFKKAHEKFDKTSGGDFRFANLDKAIKWADNTFALARDTYTAAEKARLAAQALGQFNWDLQIATQAKRIVADLVQDAKHTFRIALERRDEAAALKKKLDDTDTAAQKALIEAKGTGAPRTGK